jgi:anaerobic dimethyl sulfoxide reductase subunit C (anchor subunit)
MTTRDWSLVAFTILTQMSVGGFLLIGGIHLTALRALDANQAARLTHAPLAAAVAALVLGVLASLLHLGHPSTAYLAVANVRTSWLSREIVLTLLFGAVALTHAVLESHGVGGRGLRVAFAGATAVAGVALVFAMARIYMLPTQPAWNTAATPIAFLATTLLLGGVSVMAVMSMNGSAVGTTLAAATSRTLVVLALLSVALLGLEIVMTPLELAARGGMQAADAGAGVLASFGWLVALRLALVVAAALMLAWMVWGPAAPLAPRTTTTALAFAAFLIVLAAEVLGRVVFYATRADGAI